MKTVTTLVAGVLSDLQLLVEQQFQLAKCEIEMELRQRLTATLILGTGLAGLLIGGFMLSLAAAHSLHWLLSPAGSDPARLPFWVCEILVALLVGGIGTFAADLGRRRLLKFRISQSAEQYNRQESKRWKTGSR